MDPHNFITWSAFMTARCRTFRRHDSATLLALVLFAAVLAPAVLPAQAPARVPAAAATQAMVGGPGSANYRLAARWAPYRIDKLVHSTSVSPRWIEGGERFWYEWETGDGKFYYIVDPVRGTKRQIFDNDRIAAELTRITRDPYDRQNLPIRRIRFVSPSILHFEVESSRDEEPKPVEEKEDEKEDEEQEKELDLDEEQQQDRRPTATPRPKKKVHYFEYDVDRQVLRELDDYESPDDHPSWASVSPDGQTVVFAKQHDLYMMSGLDYARILDARRGKSGKEADEAEEKVAIEDFRLTEDGEEHYGYAVFERGDTDKERAKNVDKRKRAAIVWADDSRRFALIRFDQREVEDLWVIHSVGNKRPEIETYRYDMPGEKNVTRSELWIYDLASLTGVKVEEPGSWQDQSLNISTARQFRYPDSTDPRRALWLAPGSDELHYVRISRDRHRADMMVANAATGQARVLFEDRLNTYMETRNPERLPNGDILWWSERDGWAHLYRYGADGRLRNRITEGPFSVRSITGVDTRRGHVFFHATGRERGEDPYYEHLYRVGLDGSGLRLLNAGDYDHRAALGESTRFFVNNASRVNTTPRTTLHDADGRQILELENADFSRLAEAGWQMPEPFRVKADDGITDLFGVMYLPFDFDPAKQYPVIAYVYPGPQTEAVAKSFSTSRFETALAQFGFVVITVGNRGGHPARSKWYHNYGYGNLRDYGLADKKVTIEQLADRHAFIDIDRVGIYGHSGGGFMSTAAMLVYPDFFKVAVSSAGNHDNDVYNRWWSETHHGVKEKVDDDGNVTFEYSIARNSDLARNLKGRLLLTTGDVDNNVHMAGTLRMAEALIKANKRFDFFVFPGQRHGFGNMSDYWFWLRAEYFVKHLLGDDHWNADITQLQVERQQSR
jgi:dipeptidyl-peptidase 4